MGKVFLKIVADNVMVVRSQQDSYPNILLQKMLWLLIGMQHL